MWLSDLRLVLPDRVLEQGSLRIEDGVIAEVIEGVAPGNIPSLRGLTAIPGIVDLHGDMLERDVEPRPGARFPHELGLLELDKRLASSGITTAYAAISFAWKKDDIRSQENATALINAINERKADLLVDMKVHARFEVTNPLTALVLSALLHEKKVDLVSIMDHTPGQGQYGDIDRYINFVQTWIGVDLDVFEPGLQARLVEQIKKRMTEQTQKRRDWDIVRDVARIAREYGIPLASHDDDTVEKVAEQAEMGVTISEFPINFDAANEAHRHGMMIIMGAPNAYRKQSTGNNLSALEAIKAGLVDILATDYYPPAMMHAAFQLADEGVLPLHESVKLVSTNPAKAVGLTDRGTLTVGARADLALVEPGKHHRLRATLRAGMPIYSDAYIAQALAWKDRMPHFDVYPEELKLKRDKSLGEQPTIYDDCVIVDSDLGAWTEIGRNSMIIESSLGDYSYLAGDDDIIYTEIGKFCSIASHVRINPGNHPMQRVTQHHMTYRRKKFGFGDSDDAEFFEWRRAHHCTIGHDVWIGHGVTIMPGVSIGTGAVIGSGAVVTKDVEPYQIVVGVPAHPVRKRFSDGVIDQLLQIAWWDWDRATLEARFEDFYDMNAFIAKYGHD